MNFETPLARPIAWINVRKVVIGALGVLGILYIVFIFSYRLSGYPAPVFDEASFLKVAKNYALNGVYADYSSEGDEYAGAIISVGPTVILPVAVMFKLWGISFSLARLTAVVYACLMLLALFAFCNSLHNARLAVLAVALVAVDRVLDVQSYARTVMGEVPGLFFCFAGLWLWLRSGHRSLGGLIGVGIVLGLACITKATFAMFVLPSMLLALILDRIWYRQRGWLYFVVPGAIAGLMFFAWTYYSLFLIGAGVRDVVKDLQLLSTTTKSALLVFDINVNRRNFLFVTGDKMYLGLVIPALIYGAVLSLRRNAEGQRWGTLYLFLVVSLLVYTLSLGWIRYAIPSLTLVIPFIAFLLYRLGTYLPKLLKLPMMVGRDGLEHLMLVSSLLVIGLSWLLFVVPAHDRFLAPIQKSSDHLDRLQHYLNNEIHANALIETWEPEVMLLSNHTYHTPPHSVLVNLDAGNGPVVTTSNGTTRRYDFRDWVSADHVIIGAWARPLSIYPPENLVDYDHVRTFGTYQIYKLRASE